VTGQGGAEIAVLTLEGGEIKEGGVIREDAFGQEGVVPGGAGGGTGGGVG
jgi:hypothetical protein